MGESSELFVNCLEAMVETCLPIEDSTGAHVVPRSHNLSCSLSSLTLNSPTDKGIHRQIVIYSLSIEHNEVKTHKEEFNQENSNEYNKKIV